MRKVLLGIAVLAFSSSIAFADDIMASRYGNTTITTNPQGLQTKIYYKADGTFTGSQNGQSFGGTWKIDSSNMICLTFDPVPQGVQNPTCAPVAAHKVGDSWSAAGFTVTLVQGIQ
jgi:hypothetical protein